MIRSMSSALSGLRNHQVMLDVVGNDIANVSTVGFKSSSTVFSDVLTQTLTGAGAPGATTGGTNPAQIGLGSRLVGTVQSFTQGAIQRTGRATDLAIEGDAFFVVNSGNRRFYTRAGNFSLNANGDIVVGSSQTGRLLEPGISIPPDATAITVSPEGIVSVKQPASPTLAQVGQIELAYFINPEGLLRLGENLLAETDASGPPTTASPGQDSVGVVRQGALEASNVQPIEELIDLITTQRAYEMNSQVVKAGDQMLEIVANLRRY